MFFNICPEELRALDYSENVNFGSGNEKSSSKPNGFMNLLISKNKLQSSWGRDEVLSSPIKGVVPFTDEVQKPEKREKTNIFELAFE